MTENLKQIDETVDLPEDAPSDELRPKGFMSRFLTPTMRFSLLAVGGISAIGAAIFMTGSEQIGGSQVRTPPRLDSTPGGVIQVESPAYQDANRRANEQGADQAALTGRSFAPVLEAQFEPVTAAPDPALSIPESRPVQAAEEPRVVERRILSGLPERFAPPREAVPSQAAGQARPPQGVQTQSNQAQAPAENPYVDRMLQAMGRTSSSFAISGMNLVDTDSQTGRTSGAAAAEGSDPAAEIPAQTPPDLLFRPGDILYAETLTSVNSDAPSPVLARVVSGPFRGARIVGSFQTDTNSDRMVVSFTQMTLPDGRVIGIDAFAVDGRSAETAVASDVERRFVARYGPILASSFISGYAASAARPATSFTGGTADSLIVQSLPSPTNSLFAGVSEAARAISEDIRRNAPSGPKVILRSGYGIGVMIISPVTDPGTSGRN